MKNVAILTSFPGRIDTIDNTIYSLYNQIKPFDEIVLALYEDEFPHKELPKCVLDLTTKINTLKIRWIKYSDTYNKNMRAFKKIYTAIHDYIGTETLIYQCDDDFYYHPLYTSIYSALNERFPCAFYNCFMNMGKEKKLMISGARTVYDARILKNDLLDDTYALEKLFWKHDDDYFQYWINKEQVKMYCFNMLDYFTHDPQIQKSSFVDAEQDYSIFKDRSKLFFDDKEWREKNFPNFKECNVEYINLHPFR